MIRFLSWLSAVFWIFLGVAFMLRMRQMLDGVAFTSPDGLTGVTAIFAGLHVGIGTIILVLCLYRLYLLGVFVSACAASGLAIVRLFGMVVDHAFTASQLRDLVPEVLGLFIVVALIPRQADGQEFLISRGANYKNVRQAVAESNDRSQDRWFFGETGSATTH